jgi:hypothetical protein
LCQWWGYILCQQKKSFPKKTNRRKRLTSNIFSAILHFYSGCLFEYCNCSIARKKKVFIFILTSVVQYLEVLYSPPILTSVVHYLYFFFKKIGYFLSKLVNFIIFKAHIIENIALLVDHKYMILMGVWVCISIIPLFQIVHVSQ